MRRKRGWLSAALVFVGLALTGQAEDFRIQSFDGSGRLTFNGIPSATVYRVEWAPTPVGPWTNFTGSAGACLDAITVTGGGSVTRAVPMFYRVVADLSLNDMVLIPAGTNGGTDPDFGAYTLTVDAFYMDTCEVTKGKWDALYAWAVANGYGFDNVGDNKGADYPVSAVNWHDCVKWCNARSEKEGRTPAYYRDADYVQVYRENPLVSEPYVLESADGYRLPTEVQWEYAARGGVAGRRFPWGDTIDHDHANYIGAPASFSYDLGYADYDTRYSTGDKPFTSPVQAFSAGKNAFGLYDMAGNVGEWCYDWFPGYVGNVRVVRGGSWGAAADRCRVAYRSYDVPGGSPWVGFRTVRLVGQVTTSKLRQMAATLVCARITDAGLAAEQVNTAFNGNGRLVFNVPNNGTDYIYRVEWAPTSAGPWTNFTGAAGTWLDAIPAAGSGTVTCTVPMCYRVMATAFSFGMALIPAGTNNGIDPDGGYNLTVDAFHMDRQEVAKARWDEVAGWAATNGYDITCGDARAKAATHPVTGVTWYECLKWCNARSEREGRTPCYHVKDSVYRTGEAVPDQDCESNGYRLPTMTEWEYAARGGLQNCLLPWGNQITHSLANYFSVASYSNDVSPTRGYHPAYNDGVFPYTSPVGSFVANGYGLFDMAGNVTEWCWNAAGSRRSVRGGGWNDELHELRCHADPFLEPSTRLNNLGFRSVCR